MKIFIGRYTKYEKDFPSRQKQAYIVAESYKQAQELTGINYYELKKYFSCAELGKLGNEIVQKTCIEIGVWIQDEPWSNKPLRRIK